MARSCRRVSDILSTRAGRGDQPPSKNASSLNWRKYPKKAFSRVTDPKNSEFEGPVVPRDRRGREDSTPVKFTRSRSPCAPSEMALGAPGPSNSDFLRSDTYKKFFSLASTSIWRTCIFWMGALSPTFSDQPFGHEWTTFGFLGVNLGDYFPYFLIPIKSFQNVDLNSGCWRPKAVRFESDLRALRDHEIHIPRGRFSIWPFGPGSRKRPGAVGVGNPV